jgi:hypothetical protein
MSDDFEFNDGAVMGAAVKSWGKALTKSDKAARQAIGLVRYKYPRLTKRQDGSTAGYIRDKTDTHDMQDHQHMERHDDENAELVNDADYAADVHEGRGDRPPQRWLNEAISADASGSIEWQNHNALVNIPETFTDAFAAALP